jgi:hypothetical protein
MGFRSAEPCLLAAAARFPEPMSRFRENYFEPNLG